MSFTHHKLDIYPDPKEKTPLYVNEPQLADTYLFRYGAYGSDTPQSDNIRIYVPIDLNRRDILRKLEMIIDTYGEATEENESNFSSDVAKLVSQIEIYDQVHFARHVPKPDPRGRLTGHSKEAIELVREFVTELKNIPDGCAESFPFEMIDELTQEYLTP